MPAHVWRNWRQAILRSLTHRLIVLPRMLWLRSFSGLSFIMNLILHHFLEERHICLQSTFCYSILHCNVVTFYQGWFEVFVWAEESHRLLLKSSHLVIYSSFISPSLKNYNLSLSLRILYMYTMQFHSPISHKSFPTCTPPNFLSFFIYILIYLFQVPISAAHICTGLGPCIGVKKTTNGHILKTQWFLSQAAIHCQ